MQRPDVRIVDTQQEVINDVNIDQSEAEALLYKYGFKQTQNVPQQQKSIQSNSLTFDEMIRQQETEERRQQEERYKKLHGPKAMTFDSNRINYSETKYSSIDIDGSNTFGIKVQIVTDMKI